MIFEYAARLPKATYHLLCHYWLPLGFFIFLAAFFVMPNGHSYRVAINLMLLLPSLLAVMVVPSWWPAVQHNRGLLGLVLVYLIYFAGSAFVQDYRVGFEFLHWALYIVIFLLGGGLCMQITPQQLVHLLWLALIVAALAAVYALCRDAASGAMAQPQYRLIGYGTLYNALRSGNLFGAFFIIGVWSTLYARLFPVQRGLAAISTAILLFVVLLTGSRSPLVAMLFVILGLVLVDVPNTQRLRAIASICAITSLVLTLFWLPLMERGLSLRPELWRLTLVRAVKHFWLGVGLGQPLSLPASDGITYDNTHNVFLAALYYGGCIGVALFLALFTSIIRIAWRERASASLCTLAALLQFFSLVTLQFDGGSLVGRPADFWVLYWLPVAITLFERRHSHSKGGGL